MPDQDPWEQAAKEYQQQSGGNHFAQTGSPSTPNADWKLWQQSAPATPNQSEPSTLSKIGSTVADLGIGAGRGLVSTIHQGGNLLGKIPAVKSLNDAYWKMLGKPAPSEDYWDSVTTPTNTAQRIGKFGEQAAEFLIPGGAEEQAGKLATRLAPKAARFVAPAASTATAALGAGTVNKAQGGDFGTGALVGGAGGVVGEGLKSVAPGLAESALGIRKADRFYGRTPGKAILEDTSGFQPGTVADSARAKMGDLTSQVERSAATSPRSPSLAPARRVIDDAVQTAQRENNPKALAQLKPLADQLSTNVTTGLPLAPNQPATGLLNLKRGFGDAVGSWSPETSKSVNSVGKRAYRALDQEFDNAVPGAADLNQRVSSLIPVAKRAESAEHGAGLAQKVVHRLAAHTGAAASGLVGGGVGYREGGVPGAIAGGIAGLAVRELLTSPTGQMMAARGLASPVTHGIIRPLMQGSLLTGLRGDDSSATPPMPIKGPGAQPRPLGPSMQSAPPPAPIASLRKVPSLGPANPRRQEEEDKAAALRLARLRAVSR